MTKIQEWEKMIEKVKNDTASKIDIIRFLEQNRPKRKERKNRLPCTCGCKDIHIWWSTERHEFFCRCTACDKESVGNKFEIRAIRNWNEMIKKEIENGTAD